MDSSVLQRIYKASRQLIKYPQQHISWLWVTTRTLGPRNFEPRIFLILFLLSYSAFILDRPRISLAKSTRSMSHPVFPILFGSSIVNYRVSSSMIPYHTHISDPIFTLSSCHSRLSARTLGFLHDFTASTERRKIPPLLKEGRRPRGEIPRQYPRFRYLVSYHYSAMYGVHRPPSNALAPLPYTRFPPTHI